MAPQLAPAPQLPNSPTLRRPDPAWFHVDLATGLTSARFNFGRRQLIDPRSTYLDRPEQESLRQRRGSTSRRPPRSVAPASFRPAAARTRRGRLTCPARGPAADSAPARRSVLARTQVRRDVHDAVELGERLAPALERLGVGVQHARDPHVERAVRECEERPLAGRLQAHGDRRLPSEPEAAVALEDGDIPPDALVREDQGAPRPHRERALDPLRKPADELLGHRPAAVDPRRWSTEPADHPDGAVLGERVKPTFLPGGIVHGTRLPPSVRGMKPAIPRPLRPKEPGWRLGSRRLGSLLDELDTDRSVRSDATGYTVTCHPNMRCPAGQTRSLPRLDSAGSMLNRPSK
jgi:hypothetical protein